MAERPVLILNGPNLNMLGVRQPEIYGRETLGDLEALCRAHGASLGLAIDFRQTNAEGELIGWIQAARGTAAALIVNAAGLTHTSVAVMDALLLLEVPVIEVHLSNIHRREPFRHHSYVASAAHGSICGFGSHGYRLALDAVNELLARRATA
ncbi:MAG: type II 3-dehydroquinate dehydratase [Alphaproteobacteria bacterium]|nr:type II 3-dehydroquinate dehydratase [Alphaproteobacteria bacterium]